MGFSLSLPLPLYHIYIHTTIYKLYIYIHASTIEIKVCTVQQRKIMTKHNSLLDTFKVLHCLWMFAHIQWLEGLQHLLGKGSCI